MKVKVEYHPITFEPMFDILGFKLYRKLIQEMIGVHGGNAYIEMAKLCKDLYGSLPCLEIEFAARIRCAYCEIEYEGDMTNWWQIEVND